MAIVKEYTTKEGTVIKFNDECYKDKTPEEMKEAYNNINKVASMLLYKTRVFVD